MSEVFLNSQHVGETDNWQSFIQAIKDERRKNNVTNNVNVYYDKPLDTVYIENTKWRARRPLIVVKDGKPLFDEILKKQVEKNELSWDDLLKQGVIEYLDAAEEENALVAFLEEELTPEHTHLEITPLGLVGITTALLPYGNFSHGVRLLQGSKNQKQALGFYAANYSVRMDMDVNLLVNAQKPIVNTLMHELSDYDKHPSGQNIIVAVLSYKGYNMEDAIVINKGSIERGLGRSFYYRPNSAEELRYAGGLTDEIGLPDKDVKGYRSEEDYKFLEDDGIVYPEARVKEGDVVIGKTSPPRFLSSMDDYNLMTNFRRESSINISHGDGGTVDFVLLTENEEGNKLLHVKMREERTPEIGDKFISRYGQKGVIGLIVPHSDMPFSTNGITPDLLFSPHGIPSRMTMNHLIELVAGKTGAMAGRYINGTTFDAEPEKELRQELLGLGFRENGTETLYNGQTGQQLEAKIFIGSMYYLKLKHMVANRIHSRARGPIQLLTRQPTEGRAKEGGLRLGEMEKDTFVAHGTSLLLKERFDSDKATVPVCETCGLIGVYNEFKKKSFCPVCGDNSEISNIDMSYAFKLILDEFKSLGILPKIVLKDKY
ncbi:DNA-directed RNA polymerase subunit B [Candidatus Woesearchaeota archaeon]|nr:DNA-directed RNA polymerase subunit B [Candidatus Woesearchaeota archaeon]